jgi:tripartite-type tricarboxylate transporter receptor subunit TctC
MKRTISAALATAALLTLSATAARADPVAAFYKGRQIAMILSAGEGGGYASYAHAFAPFFSAHIPGKPKIIIQHLPGAGGIRAMNYLSSVAPKDGSTIGFVHSSVPFAPLFGIEGAKFDPRQMGWIGSINATSAICVAWHTSPIKTWQDLFDKEFIVGGTGVGSQMETFPAMLNKLFGTRIKIISGYKGGHDIYLAMERGEVHGRCGGLVSSIRSTRPDWFPQRKVTVPIQVSLERNSLFPDVPAIVELAKDERTKQVLQLILAPQDMDRPLLTPPGVPAERIAALRAAFHAAVNDPGFIAEASRLQLEINEIPGEKVEQILHAAFALPPEVIKIAGEAVKLTGASADR